MLVSFGPTLLLSTGWQPCAWCNRFIYKSTLCSHCHVNGQWVRKTGHPFQGTWLRNAEMGTSLSLYFQWWLCTQLLEAECIIVPISPQSQSFCLPSNTYTQMYTRYSYKTIQVRSSLWLFACDTGSLRLAVCVPSQHILSFKRRKYTPVPVILR